MSHHIDNKSMPPEPHHCCGDMSFNHETGEMKGQSDCGCKPGEVKPSRLDLLIAQYEALKKEAEAARDEFIREALAFDMQECTQKQVEQIFDGLMWEGDEWMWCPSLDVDADGYAQLNVVVDEEGWAHFVDD